MTIISSLGDELSSVIREIPDYPRPGVIFRDVTTLFLDSRAFRRSVDALIYPYLDSKIDYVAGIEARGFVLGGAIAHSLTSGFLSVRKKGKLPRETIKIGYSMEYGLDEMEIHRDALTEGDRVLIVDDLIATGGTAEAAVRLCQKIGAEVIAACFVVDLPDLGGRSKIESLGVPVHTLIAFEGE